MQCSKHHKELNEQGYGKCSVPMWQYPGVPAGFCNHIAFGEPLPYKTFRDDLGKLQRYDGGYCGYVPGLACYVHGGPKYNQKIPLGNPYHLGDPCIYCGTPHDDVKPGPCPARETVQ